MYDMASMIESWHSSKAIWRMFPLGSVIRECNREHELIPMNAQYHIFIVWSNTLFIYTTNSKLHCYMLARREYNDNNDNYNDTISCSID